MKRTGTNQASKTFEKSVRNFSIIDQNLPARLVENSHDGTPVTRKYLKIWTKLGPNMTTSSVGKIKKRSGKINFTGAFKIWACIFCFRFFLSSSAWVLSVLTRLVPSLFDWMTART